MNNLDEIDILSMNDEELKECVSDDTTDSGTQASQNEETAQSVQNVTQTEKQDSNKSQNTQLNLRKVFSHRSDDEISEKPQPIPYLIKGYLREKGLHMLYGESGCGKGFCILDMCESIARYEIDSWHGVPIKHGDVIYFCGESADGLNTRIKVWKDTRGIKEKGATFEIIDEIFNIDEENPKSDYCIDNTIANIKSLSDNPALVVIDPINIYMSGDENSAKDTGNFLSACRKIINECGCAVLFVQHVGLNPDAKTRARGSSAFYAGVDSAMLLKKDGDILTLSVKKQKEGKIPPDLIFNLTEHVIERWFDEDNEPVTSCTIELADKLMEYRENMQAEKKKPKLKPAQQFAVDSFREAAKIHGQIIIDNPETSHEIIRLEDSHWRDYVFEKLPSTNEDEKKDKENKRVKFYKTKKYLTIDTHTLTIQREGGYEYYCLDLSGDTEPAYRLEIRTAIKNREKLETGAGGSGGGEVAETNSAESTDTGERTGELFDTPCEKL